MTKLHGVAAVLLASAAVAAVAGATSGTAAAGTAQPEDSCPSVVTLVARGSEENDVYPATASNGFSNGYEGQTIHRFLDYATTVHPGLFDGQDRTVLAVDADRYPARFPLGKAGEDPDPVALVNGVGLFVDSMATGLPGGLDTVEGYERVSGCHPDYVGLGYSQGVAVLTPVQHKLAAEGRLRGSVYFGNPFHRMPELIGGGAMTDVPVHSYCLTDDFACDTGVRSIALALADEEDSGAHATYLRGAAADVAVTPDDATRQERAAADALAAYVS